MAMEAVMRLVRDGTLLGSDDAVIVGNAVVSQGGDVTGGPGTILDPLEGGLLLVEEFARLDVADRASVAAWVARRGPLSTEASRIGQKYRLMHSPLVADAVMLRDAPMYGPYPPFRIRAAAAPDAEYMVEQGYVVDYFVSIEYAQLDIRDSLAALVDGDPHKFWSLGEWLQGWMTDALGFLVLNSAEGRQQTKFEVLVSWVSALQPMHVQLFMAYRRALEGQPAATRCKDCGEIFLILDGRRATYCNARCRNRFNVRAFRARAKEKA